MIISKVIQDMKKDDAIDYIIDKNEGLCLLEAMEIYNSWRIEYMKPKVKARSEGKILGRKKLLEDHKEQIIDDYLNKQMSLVKIGEQFDTASSTVGIVLREWGIPIRTKAEQLRINARLGRNNEQIQC